MHATPKQRQSGATAPEQFEGGTTGVTGRAQPGETQLPNRARNGVFVPTHQVHDLFPALVTPEEFIRAFSGLRHSHAVVAREFGEEIDRHADRIRDGLVLQVDHAGKEIEEVPLIENALMVNSPDAGCASASRRSAISSSETPVNGVVWSRTSQYRSSPTCPPASIVRKEPGRSFLMPSNKVSGAGVDMNER